jgi:membrane-associated protein
LQPPGFLGVECLADPQLLPIITTPSIITNQTANLWAFLFVINIAILVSLQIYILITMESLSYCKIAVMTLLSFLDVAVDWLLHLDKHLQALVAEYKSFTYVILFLIVFVETGLVVMPLLPGDSLLFAAGSIAAMDNTLNIFILIPLLIGAALLGDNINYFIGSKFGTKVFDLNWKLLKREYLERTEQFYEKHGGYTLIMARFVPIVRTFAPFAAGLGTMSYKKFIGYCISGAVLWVTSISTAGYFFGKLPWVQKNFELVVFGIIGISLLPIVFQAFKAKFSK